MFNSIRKWARSRRLNRLKRQLKDPDYHYLFDSQPDVFVSFDCETTGLDRKKDRIITLSAIKIIQSDILTSQSLNLVIKQGDAISADSIKIHQIRNIDVENCEVSYDEEFQAIQAFLEFIKGATLVGYYLEFDIAMVNRVIKPYLGIGLPNPQIEVSRMYYAFVQTQYKQSFIEANVDLSFDSILKRLGIPNQGQHDAYNDALMTALIFVKLQQDSSFK